MIMNDLLDWWMVLGVCWGVWNMDFKVELKWDGVVSFFLLEDYSEEDIWVFDGGDW